MDFSHVTDFGGIDADADELLAECFQDHPAYLKALEHRCFLVLGRKGSGKTAIFKRLLTPAWDAFSYGHTFDEYPWEHHSLQAQIGVPEERRFIQSWKYLIFLSTAKILLNFDGSQPWSDESQDALGSIERFVVDSYGSRDPDVTQLFQPARKLRLRGALRPPMAELGAEAMPMTDLPRHIQEVNRRVGEAIVTSLNPGYDYYICFDQLDLGFNPADVEYTQRLIGLIIAARDISLAARNAEKRLSVIVFLRDDIYQELQFEDKNKVTENHAARVDWVREGQGLPLKQLMERRFGQVFAGGGTLGWDHVFDEAREMPGRQRKYAHICDRTFLRPRDMIKFCNEALKAYQSKESKPDTERFDNECIINARETYSEYLLNELDDEIAKHVPRYKEYLEVVKSIGKMHFGPDEFEAAMGKHAALRNLEPGSVLQQLFEFSVLGFLRSGGTGGGAKYIWRYQDARARFGGEIENFRVHPGLKEALDLKW